MFSNDPFGTHCICEQNVNPRPAETGLFQDKSARTMSVHALVPSIGRKDKRSIVFNEEIARLYTTSQCSLMET